MMFVAGMGFLFLGIGALLRINAYAHANDRKNKEAVK
jgi:hypothetical protein